MTRAVKRPWRGLRWHLGLRWTLLLALLPLLTLPWIGLRFVERMAELARDERLENQASAARALAAALHERRELFESVEGTPLPIGAQALPVETVTATSGDEPDWATVPWRELPVRNNPASPNNLLRARLAAAQIRGHGDALYLQIDVDDERYVARRQKNVADPSAVDGDEAIVEAGPTADTMTRQSLLIDARPGGWQAHVRFATRPTVLRVLLRDVDYLGSRRVEGEADSGLLGPSNAANAPAHDASGRSLQPIWTDTLRALQRVSGRVSIYDANGVLRAQQGTLSAAPVEPAGWQARLAQFLLSTAVRIQPEASDRDRDRDHDSNAPDRGGTSDAGEPEQPRIDPLSNNVNVLSPLARALAGAPAQRSQRAGIQGGMPAWILTSAHPIWVGDNIVGALVLDENTATRLVLGQAALERLTLLAALAVAASVVALLLVASITVGRVVRLRNEAEAAIDQRGRVVRTIGETALADELGDLRSSYARVLARLREHQDYLANLRSRLVHELRTPIMVVRSSLENLSVEGDRDQQAAYISRVQAGATRLERIVASMGEASSLESMLADSGLEDVDLRRLLTACADGYRGAFAPRRFDVHIGVDQALCSGVPEAIAQALDKLVSNAVDFATAGTPIMLSLMPLDAAEPAPPALQTPRPRRRAWLGAWLASGRSGGDDRSANTSLRRTVFWRIAVINQGPPLPRNMGESLLDQMVSVRGERQSDQSHLGLGLYLVRLIAEFHGGEAYLRNLEDGVEAGFTLRSAGSVGAAHSALPMAEPSIA